MNAAFFIWALAKKHCFDIKIDLGIWKASEEEPQPSFFSPQVYDYLFMYFKAALAQPYKDLWRMPCCPCWKAENEIAHRRHQHFITTIVKLHQCAAAAVVVAFVAVVPKENSSSISQFRCHMLSLLKPFCVYFLDLVSAWWSTPSSKTNQLTLSRAACQ